MSNRVLPEPDHFATCPLNGNLAYFDGVLESVFVLLPDKSILWTTHWDSHFSFLCGSRDALRSLVRRVDFEGFL